MKYALLAVFAPLLTVFAGVVVLADDTPDGFREDGYTYHAADGYWHKDGIPHSRERREWQELVPNPRGYGYIYQPKHSFKYNRVVLPPKEKEVEEYPSHKDPEWRKKLLDIASTRDKYESNLRRAAAEHAQYLEAVKSLGLEGNFYWKNYGQSPPMANPYRYPMSSSLQLGNYGVSGNTIYGYNFSQLMDAYGTTDANLLYQQAAALAQNSQNLGGQATERFHGLVEQSGTHKAKVAEALARAAESQAKGYAAKLALEAAAPAPSVSTRIEGSGTIVVPTPLPQQQNSLSDRQKLAVSSCVSCHSGSQLKGGFDVTRHWGMDPTLQVKVVERLMADPSDPRFMPKGGKKLPPDLIIEFLPVKMGKVR